MSVLGSIQTLAFHPSPKAFLLDTLHQGTIGCIVGSGLPPEEAPILIAEKRKLFIILSRYRTNLRP